MKKGLLALTMVVALGLVANVALTQDDTVYFPFWQDGFGMGTFFSVSNAHETLPVDVTINLLDEAGDVLVATTGTVQPGTVWLPDTYMDWYKDVVTEDAIGFGNFEIDWLGETPSNNVYLWGCVYTFVVAPYGNMQPGFTLVLPQNPYGAGM
jgi:hypothetical protein